MAKKAPGTDFVNSLDSNPLNWPADLSTSLGLSPGDPRGLAPYEGTHNNQADPTLTQTRGPGGKYPMYNYDPATGQYFYIDYRTGDHIPVANPSVATQVGTSNLKSQEYDRRALGYGQRESDIFGEQSDLAGYLNDVIAGKTPSVAERQLGAGLDTIKRSALGMSSGAGGANAPLLQLAAINAGSQAGAQTNQQQAIVRAGDQERARGELANLLNSQETSSHGLYNDTTGLGFQYSDQALRGEAANEGLALSTEQAQARGNAAAIKGIGDTIAAFYGGGSQQTQTKR